MGYRGRPEATPQNPLAIQVIFPSHHEVSLASLLRSDPAILQRSFGRQFGTRALLEEMNQGPTKVERTVSEAILVMASTVHNSASLPVF